MTGSPTPARLAELPGVPAGCASPPGAPPGVPPDGPPFQSALESEWARTASAEGPHDNSSGASSEASPREHTDNSEGAGGELAAAHRAAAQTHIAHTSAAHARARTHPSTPGTEQADRETAARSAQGSGKTTAPGAAGAGPELASQQTSPAAPDTPNPAGNALAQVPHAGAGTGSSTATPLASSSAGARGTAGNPGATGPAQTSSSSHDQAAVTSTVGTPETAASTDPKGVAGNETPEGAGATGATSGPASDENATGSAAATGGERGVTDGANTTGSAEGARSVGAAASDGALAPPNPHTGPSTSTPSSTPPGTQPTAAVAGTPTPSPSPQAVSVAAATTPGAATHGPISPRAGAAALHSAPLPIPRGGGEGAAGDAAAHGEHRDGAHTDTTGNTSPSGAGGEVHDTLWVPDSTLQSPTEASTAGPTSGAPAQALGVYDSAGDPALAGDFGPLADLGALDLGGGLAQAIETLGATIELAARQGVSQARIALHPAELGGIRIHLSQTAEGLLARVTADTPAAAQALASGHAELHQSLGQLGLGSVRLHIAHGGSALQGEAGAGTEGRQAGRRANQAQVPRAPASAGQPTAAAAAGDAQTDPQTDPRTLPRSGRALDVLV